MFCENGCWRRRHFSIASFRANLHMRATLCAGVVGRPGRGFAAGHSSGAGKSHDQIPHQPHALLEIPTDEGDRRTCCPFLFV